MIRVSAVSRVCILAARPRVRHMVIIRLLRSRAKGVKTHTLDTVDTAGKISLHATPRRNSYRWGAHCNAVRSSRNAVYRHWARQAQACHGYFPTRFSRVGPREQRPIHIEFVAMSGPVLGRPGAPPVGPWANGRGRGVPASPSAASLAFALSVSSQTPIFKTTFFRRGNLIKFL